MTTRPPLSLRRTAAGHLLLVLLACLASLGSCSPGGQGLAPVVSSAEEAIRTDSEAIRTADPYATLKEIFEARTPIYGLAELSVEAQAAYSIEEMSGKVIEALLAETSESSDAQGQ